MDNNINDFHSAISEHLEKSEFIKLVISNKRDKNNELRTVTIKPTLIKKGFVLNFVYRYPTKDITKNYAIEEGKVLINELIATDFLQAELITTEFNYHLSINKKNIVRIKKSASVNSKTLVLDHDKQKPRLIVSQNNTYLKELGVIAADGSVKHSMQDKYKQINKYIELLDGILKTVEIGPSFNVADMGAGKGYLTFALYDYFST
jgi:hypothetical protein